MRSFRWRVRGRRGRIVPSLAHCLARRRSAPSQLFSADSTEPPTERAARTGSARRPWRRGSASRPRCAPPRRRPPGPRGGGGGPGRRPGRSRAGRPPAARARARAAPGCAPPRAGACAR